VRQHQLGNSSRPHVATSSAGPVFCPAQPQIQPRPQAARQGFSTPQCQVTERPKNLHTPATENQSVQRTQAAQDPLQADHRCYNCGEKGHYANRCPNPRTRANQTTTPTPALTSGANSIPIAAKQNYAHGRVNHVVVEKAQEALDVVIGMFFLSMTLLQLCHLILEHRILSYPLHMLRSIIYL
jgi:hypothetical protein